MRKFVNCEWCGVRFKPTNDVQKYCKRQHAVKASHHRNKTVEEYALCPTPGKRTYATVAEAVELGGPGSKDGAYRIYRCQCGKYHHGHDSEARRARRATKAKGSFRIYYKKTTNWGAKWNYTGTKSN